MIDSIEVIVTVYQKIVPHLQVIDIIRNYFEYNGDTKKEQAGNDIPQRKRKR